MARDLWVDKCIDQWFIWAEFGISSYGPWFPKLLYESLEQTSKTNLNETAAFFCLNHKHAWCLLKHQGFPSAMCVINRLKTFKGSIKAQTVPSGVYCNWRKDTHKNSLFKQLHCIVLHGKECRNAQNMECHIFMIQFDCSNDFIHHQIWPLSYYNLSCTFVFLCPCTSPHPIFS